LGRADIHTSPLNFDPNDTYNGLIAPLHCKLDDGRVGGALDWRGRAKMKKAPVSEGLRLRLSVRCGRLL
jgi:hypothetical protein